MIKNAVEVISNEPEVTCLQTSYGRPQLSVEAVECFLRQTYPKKHLIIVNTHHSPVYFDKTYPNITVHNTPPFPALSDVYRFGMDQIKTKYMCIWDDDDLFLPWHIQDRVDAAYKHPEYDAYGLPHAIFSVGNVMESVSENMFVASFMYENNGIRPDAGLATWDVNWYNKPWKWYKMTKPNKLSYVYRWGTGESHISGLAGEQGQMQGYLNNITDKAKLSFNDPWIPMWQKDYVKEAEELISKIWTI
jgi:hypothetical protein